MYSIGQFAQLGQVSVRALRIYDDRGLLGPAEVDRWSGHRRYTAHQLADLNRILALKDLGLTLSEIASLLSEPPSAEELTGMLRLRRQEVARSAEAEQRRLARVEASIALLSAAPDLDELGDHVVVKSVPDRRMASLQGTAADFDDNLPGLFEQLYGDIFGALEEEGVRSAGPHTSWYEELPDGRLAVHAGVPVEDAAEVGGLATRTLPGAPRVATCMHRGPLSEACDGYRRLQRWLATVGETPRGLSREVHLDAVGPPEDWITELQFVLPPMSGSVQPAEPTSTTEIEA
ncbi:MerR family transcriptional regulator [Euzebya tangerina]|uniref:MerR family transcriptional regulator n=1 Tax=Euzebya tangerina TaxID=591198 RepID=UPI000E324669|nr:MerR family transcriptional regulator [Euzebya tangerina]